MGELIITEDQLTFPWRERTRMCPRCKGKGQRGKVPCITCEGKGEIEIVATVATPTNEV